MALSARGPHSRTGCLLAGAVGQLLALPAIASIAYILLPDQMFSYIDRFAVLPFSLVMVVWIVYALVHSALWQRRWESALILISVLGTCTLVVHDTLIIANVTPDSNFLHFRIVYILLLLALSVIFFQHSRNQWTMLMISSARWTNALSIRKHNCAKRFSNGRNWRGGKH